jgi:hypothetical protein
MVDRSVYALADAAATSFSLQRPSSSVQLSSWLRSSSLILLSKFAILKKSQRDSYIELLEKKVKQKMHLRRISLQRSGAMNV